ncbi:MAG: sterol 24-C-methyltransferase [Solirubrobacteraceae bacterium]|jgi:SAM-dependent methyltransferase|nr:sterol 24-C-methyltransferase [Solirubrobacteraceae bacterium]
MAQQDLLEEIERRLGRLRRVFDVSSLRGQGATPEAIRRYYERSRIGYRYVHCADGAMHMALNPRGTFDRAGYEGQALLVHERLAPGARDVLELACGNGYNLRLLAARNRGRRFVGVELIASQVARARRTLAHLPDARALVGDFQALAFADETQDCVFVVESLCHAIDLPRALSEAARVLRPDGRFVVIDGWRTDAFDGLPAIVREATVAIELAMAVSAGRSLSSWKSTAARCGLRVTEELDLTDQIVPNLARLAAIAERFVSRPALARAARFVAPDALLMNAVAAYLMPLAVQAGAHTYRLIVLERAS